MSEWPKEHAWKVCIPQKGIKGSNPFLSASVAVEYAATKRRDARVVERDGLENRFTRKCNEGSNPPLSARLFCSQFYQLTSIIFYLLHFTFFHTVKIY